MCPDGRLIFPNPQDAWQREAGNLRFFNTQPSPHGGQSFSRQVVAQTVLLQYRCAGNTQYHRQIASYYHKEGGLQKIVKLCLKGSLTVKSGRLVEWDAISTGKQLPRFAKIQCFLQSQAVQEDVGNLCNRSIQRTFQQTNRQNVTLRASLKFSRRVISFTGETQT